ncbi:uncharacterized protein DEA37_0005793 [Paragonimus westermani]|uniref:General transcription factor IIF subunit 1 n=1 Tax=Paragonimus westermani TaxID=34504 RepID=A0A5J4NPI2_9TREM|nr:uncharacterized protein DEA37_0005793 [Paragonimus westermani]
MFGSTALKTLSRNQPNLVYLLPNGLSLASSSASGVCQKKLIGNLLYLYFTRTSAKSIPSGVSDQLNSPSVPPTPQPAINTPLRPSTASNSSTPVVVIRSIATTPGSTAATGAGIRIASVLPNPFKVTSSNAIIRPVVSIPAVKPIILPSPIIKPSPNPSDPLPSVKSEPIPTAPSGPNPVPQRNIIREMQASLVFVYHNLHVRVPNRRDKRFSVLRFHSADHPDLSSGLELFMQRENNLKQFRSVHNLSDTPERGAGSEFGREAKEEARLRKYGIIRESYRPDDQPWIMTVGKGKTGRRRFKGVREGSVSENVEYFVFCQCKDGNFDAYPVHTWYKMKPEINYRFLREDEAEVEYNRLNKTMNLFNVMIKRKLTDGEVAEDETEGSTVNRELGKELRYLSVATENRATTDKSSGTTSGRATVELKTDGSRKSNRALKLTDLEELDSDSDIEEEVEEEAEDDQNMSSAEGAKAGSSRSKIGLVLDESAKLKAKANTAKAVAERARLLRKKQRDATIVSRMRRCVKKRKARKGPAAGSSSENDDPLDEAEDESEVDDHEGDEVDYMTNSSSDEEKLSLEDRERIYDETGVDEETGLRALLTDLSHLFRVITSASFNDWHAVTCLWVGQMTYRVGVEETGRGGFEVASDYFDFQEVDAARLDNRRVLVTGANSGIGLACCQDLAKRGAEVHMVCRNPERGQEARATVIRTTGDPEAPVYLHQVDLSQPRNVFEFARTFEAELGKLDILPRVIVVSSGGMLLQRLNHSDPMLVQKRSHFDGAMVYAQNKRQQVVMTEMWAEKYMNIRFSCMHPGWADTPGVALSLPSFYHYMQSRLRTPDQGADTVIWLALTPTIKSYPNGSFFQDRKLASTHLPLARTHSSKEEKLHFMLLLAQLAESFVC